MIFNIESIDDCLEKINAYRKARNWSPFGKSFLRIKDLCCYKLYCFISISLWKRPLDPLIMMKRPGTVIFLHIKIMGCKWNIISHGHYSLSTWVQQVMIISDDILWSYLYIHRVEIGFKIWNSEPDVSDWSKFIILSRFFTAIRRVLRICPAIRRITCCTTLEYIEAIKYGNLRT